MEIIDQQQYRASPSMNRLLLQIKALIISGELETGEPIPSMRALANLCM